MQCASKNRFGSYLTLERLLGPPGPPRTPVILLFTVWIPFSFLGKNKTYLCCHLNHEASCKKLCNEIVVEIMLDNFRDRLSSNQYDKVAKVATSKAATHYNKKEQLYTSEPLH